MKQKFTGKGELIKRLAFQVGSEAAAKTILKRRGQMNEDGSLTSKGQKRNAMSASERAKDRAAKRSGKPASSYSYDRSNNRAKLR